MPFLGEIFALSAAVCWSAAVILYRKTGESVAPLALNLFKNVLAVLLFSVTMIALGRAFVRDVPARDYAMLFASGAIGIGLSDLFFFMTLNRVGAGLQAIITTTYSPSIILLGVLFLGERMSLLQIAGVAMILAAVGSITSMRGPAGGEPRRGLAAGIAFGLLATSTQAVSVVMVKPILNDSPLLWANLWRLAGGLAASLALWPMIPNRARALRSLRDRKVWRFMLPATVIGTYISLLFWLGGMKLTQISTASVLNQTATLWTFLFAALFLREPVTWRRVAGLCAGACGVLLVTFGPWLSRGR